MNYREPCALLAASYKKCSAAFFQCKDNGHCIYNSKVCDNKPDCKDNSDEIGCGECYAANSVAYLASKQQAGVNEGGSRTGNAFEAIMRFHRLIAIIEVPRYITSTLEK